MNNTVEEIKLLLQQYRKNKAICEEKKKAYECLKEGLTLEKQRSIEEVTEYIEGSCLQSPFLSHIPRSITNKFSSKTENVGLNYREELYSDKYSKTLLEALSILNTELAELNDKISLTDNLISSLKDKHRFIVERKYIQGYTNKEVNAMYNEVFMFRLEERQLFRLKKEALQEMASILNRLEGLL